MLYEKGFRYKARLIMAEEKVLIKIKGHEKFALREGWLNKGILAVQDSPRIFLQSNAPETLGVGSNMVK